MPNVEDKETIFKTAREKRKIIYKGVPVRLSADFSQETLQARKDWQEVFKMMKKQGPTSKITLSSKDII